MNKDAYISPEKREFKFNDHVVVEMVFGLTDSQRSGRLVQVRKNVGAFGSDVYFIRNADETLRTFENVMIRHVNDKNFEEAFYVSNGSNPPNIPFQPINDIDTIKTAYSYANNQYPEVGFIIKSPNQPASEKQSFTMMITQK
jgi:hypothetical protein